MTEGPFGPKPSIATMVLLTVVLILVIGFATGAFEPSPGELTRICMNRAGENFTYLNDSTGTWNTMYCEHPNGTVREVSNLVNSTA